MEDRSGLRVRQSTCRRREHREATTRLTRRAAGFIVPGNEGWKPVRIRTVAPL